VWDWQAERELYRVPIRETPLFLHYSALGTYLMYSDASWQSLTIRKSETGEQVAFHPEGFGIVGFAEMSRSEKTILTYQVAGKISTWDFATGALTGQVPAVPALADVRISRDLRFLAGTAGDEIVTVDLMTGAVRARAALPAAIAIEIAAGSDELAGVSATDGTVRRWAIAGEALLPRATQANGSPLSASLVCYGGKELFLAGGSAPLRAVDMAGDMREFGKNLLAGVTDLDAAEGMLALCSSDWIRVFGFELSAGAPLPTSLRTRAAENPIKSSTRISFLTATRLFAWRNDGISAGMAMLEISALSAGNAPPFELRPYAAGFAAPLTSFSVNGGLAVGIEAGGLIRLTDIGAGLSLFSARVPGANTAVAVSTAELLAGRSTVTALEGSLVKIDTRTGETVGIRNPNALIFNVLLDPSGREIYSVGVDEAGATNLLRHAGSGYEQVTVLDSVAEEGTEASIALDPTPRRLYASLGRDRVVAWDGAQLRAVPVQGSAARKLAARNGLLYSLNRDGTVTVLSGQSGRRLAEIALFADGEWCALFDGGRYAASPGGDARVRVFLDDAAVPAPEEYRVRLAIP
jgi:hypothetical protein